MGKELTLLKVSSSLLDPSQSFRRSNEDIHRPFSISRYSKEPPRIVLLAKRIGSDVLGIKVFSLSIWSRHHLSSSLTRLVQSLSRNPKACKWKQSAATLRSSRMEETNVGKKNAGHVKVCDPRDDSFTRSPAFRSIISVPCFSRSRSEKPKWRAAIFRDDVHGSMEGRKGRNGINKLFLRSICLTCRNDGSCDGSLLLFHAW